MNETNAAALAVRRDFGASAYAVAAALLSRGSSSLNELNTTLTEVSDISGAVSLLLRHDLIAIDDAVDTASKSKRYASNHQTCLTQVRYVALASNMMQRWRFPFYCDLVGRLFGDEARSLMEHVMQQTACGEKELLLNHVASRASVFKRLVEASILVESKPSSIGDSTTPAKTSEQTATRKRKMHADNELEGSQNRPPMLQGLQDPEPIYRIDFARLRTVARNHMLLELARSSVDNDAAAIIETLLSSSTLWSITDYTTDARAVAMSREDVYAQILEKRGIFERSRFEELCDLMTRSDFGFLRQSKDELVVDVQNMMHVLRLRNVEEIVLRQCGTDGRRMFRLLMKMKRLEARQAAEYAMFPQKRAREVLYSLYKNGYADVQEIPRSNDYKQSRCFYAWRVDINSVFKRVLEQYNFSSLNLCSRLSLLCEQCKDDTSTAQISKDEATSKQTQLLILSLSRLQNSAMLFSDL